MLPMEYVIIIGLAVWAIALEYKLRTRDHEIMVVALAIRAVGEGRAHITLRDNKIVFEPTTNNGVK